MAKLYLIVLKGTLKKYTQRFLIPILLRKTTPKQKQMVTDTERSIIQEEDKDKEDAEENSCEGNQCEKPYSASQKKRILRYCSVKTNKNRFR